MLSIEFASPVSSTPMFAKLCAAWLVALVLFTAPLSAFDATDLLPGHGDDIRCGRSSAATTAIARATLAHAAPFSLRSGRLRIAMSRLRLSSALVVPYRSPQAPVEASTVHARHPSSRPTVLRI